MGKESIVHHTRVERDAMGHVTLSLQHAKVLTVTDGKFSRSLPRLLVTKPFQMHMERMFALEGLTAIWMAFVNCGRNLRIE